MKIDLYAIKDRPGKSYCTLAVIQGHAPPDVCMFFGTLIPLNVTMEFDTSTPIEGVEMLGANDMLRDNNFAAFGSGFVPPQVSAFDRLVS
jgi:hypothetical protein